MIKKVVLTGGPGTGKTRVLEKITQVYEPLGYKVIVIDETATYLILHGIRPFGEGAINMVDFQELVLRLQLAKESIFERATEMLPKDTKVLIVYDRGTIDNCAYVNQREFSEVLSRLETNQNLADLMDHYDLVINLVGRKDFYTKENNAARSEDVNAALELGETTLKGWLGHSKVKIVLPKDTIEEKINEVLNLINEALSEKQVKRQEKYAVDLSSTDMTRIYENGRAVRITQTYLQSPANVEKRLRKIDFNDCTSYYFGIFKTLDDGTKTQVSEKKIDKSVYEELLDFQDESYNPITKTRYYFADDGQYFSLDVFDDAADIGILEVNISDGAHPTIPPYISVLENVTQNANYYNKNIALKTGKRLEKVGN